MSHIAQDIIVSFLCMREMDFENNLQGYNVLLKAQSFSETIDCDEHVVGKSEVLGENYMANRYLH